MKRGSRLRAVMETVPSGELDSLRARIAALEAELAAEKDHFDRSLTLVQNHERTIAGAWKGTADMLEADVVRLRQELAAERGKNEVLQDRVDVLEVEAGWDKPRLETQP